MIDRNLENLLADMIEQPAMAEFIRDQFTAFYITVMGVISIVYSVLGGINAVIWADVVQTVVLLGGALVSFVIILRGIDGGFGSFLEVAVAHDKFRMAHLSWDITTSSLWIVFLGSVFNHLIPLTSDQAYVQRHTNAIFFVYAPVGTLTCVVVGYLASFLTGANRTPLAGLTYYTLKEQAETGGPRRA